MTRRGAVVGLWIAFAGVTWNVIFDRAVTDAALEFARDQILRDERGEATASIDAGFTPRVHDAAVRASWWVTPIVAAGAVAVYRTWRKP